MDGRTDGPLVANSYCRTREFCNACGANNVVVRAGAQVAGFALLFMRESVAGLDCRSPDCMTNFRVAKSANLR